MADMSVGADSPCREVPCDDLAHLFAGAVSQEAPRKKGKPFRFTIDDMRKLAASRGGECLSDVYRGSAKALHWRCRNSHEWHVAPIGVTYAGTWCATCARAGSSLGERVSRAVLERMFGVPFPKRRPSWLDAGGGRRLELDGYAEERQIAFEYHGPQHYQPDSRYTAEMVAKQQTRDAKKSQLCREHSVTLIVIPDFKKARHLAGCIDQIEHAVLWAGLKIPRGWKRPKDLPEIEDPLNRVFGQHRVSEMHRIARERRGKLLSTTTTRARDPLLWMCEHGHQWEREPLAIESGHWCPECGRQDRVTSHRRIAADRGINLNAMNDLASSKGGVCLSTNYENARQKLRWMCSEGHTWSTTRRHVERGNWCGKCQGHSIDDMRALAASRGGKCLSDQYVSVNDKLLWLCSCGNSWWAQPRAVLRGTWCSPCGRKSQWTVRHKKAAAREALAE